MNRKASLGKLAVGIVAVAALVALDQWTKYRAESALAGRGELRLIDSFAVLTFTRNSGAFLSLGAGLPSALKALFLVALPLAALAYIAFALLRRRGGSGEGAEPGRGGGPRAIEIAAALLLAAGGLGNLIDRVAYGSVRDFLYFGLGRLRTGIMNLADLYILAALVVVVATAITARARPGSL